MKSRLSAKQRAFISLLGAFLITAASGFSGSVPLFYSPVTAEFGFTTAALALHVTIMSVCGAVTQPIFGRIMTKHPARLKLLAFIGALVGLMCYFLLSRSSKLPHFYAVGAVMSILLPIVGSLLGVTVITQWFHIRRSLAIAIVHMGVSAGEIIYSQTTRYFIENAGWRAGYISMGLVTFVLAGVGCLLISSLPEKYGLKPYGWTAEAESSGPKTVLRGFTLKQAIKTPAFWLCAVATAASCAYVMGVLQSILPMLQTDYGFTAALAASVYAIHNVVSAASKPVGGICYEKFKSTRMIPVVGALTTASMLTLMLGQNLAAAIAGLVLLGMGNMMSTVIMSSFVAEKFGNREYSSIMGCINVAFTLGISLGPIISGGIFDQTGSYRTAYLIFAILIASATIMMLIADRNVLKCRAKFGIEL